MARPRDDMQLKVFISHQWMDKQLADRLARDLEEYADVWMDYRNLRPGDPIQSTIDDALRQTDLVLLLWTEHAQRLSGVKAEICTCLNLGVRLVPYIFAYDDQGNPFPPLLKSLQKLLGVDFHHYGSGLAQVADLILHLQTERLPTEAAIDEYPGRGMLQYLGVISATWLTIGVSMERRTSARTGLIRLSAKSSCIWRAVATTVLSGCC